MSVGTAANSLGTFIADEVIFNGVTNSVSDQLAFKFGSTGKITNCSFTAVDLTCNLSNPEIRNNKFNNALVSLNESSPAIHDNTFENVAYPVEFVNECSPALSNLFMNSVTNPGIKLSGTVNTDWTLQNYGYPYYLTAALTINSGAKMTSADYNRILFNGYSINVGSSATSMGSFSARRNSFINLKTSDYYLYYKFSAGGELDSCDIKGLRVHIDASSPKITRSKFHKAQNAVYVINNGNPELSENIFYNNTIAMKNAGTNTVIAQNNFWGHKSGPIHPSNPTGKGEKIEGTVDFSGYSEKPLYGKIVPQFSVENLVFDTLLIGKYKDVTLTVKSKGDIDLLIPDILTTDPSFSIQIPASRRGWISDEDSMKVTVRFRPQRPLSYNEIANFLTNETDKPSYPIQLTGVGLPVLTFGIDSLVFDSVNYKLPQTKYIKIENISKDYTVLIDSIVNFNFKVLVFENKKPDLSKVKSENDETKNIESGIKNFGFVVYNTTPTYLAVKYYPYQSVSDSDEIRIYYNGGGLHKVKFRANIISDKVSAQILSLDYRQFPNVYLNAQIDTFAVNHNQFTEKDIQVFENGVLQTEGYKVTLPGEGNNTRLTDIVFMMDNSGSMSEEQAQVRNNVYKFLTTLNRKGINFSLGLCRYGASENSGNPIIENNGILTQDSTYFKNTLWAKNNVSGGSEPGYYAIMQSAANFKFRPGSQKVFIIITDETPKQGSLGSFEGAINACLNQKITLFAFTINDLYQLFTPITDLTKGRVFNITSSFDLLLEIISNMVSNNYVIQYTSSDPLLNGITRHVEIKVNYNSVTASDTTSYVPGAIPSIKRTNPTLSLHTKAWEPGTPLNIEVEVLDAIPPFANNVILYYRKSNTPVYYSLQMNSTNGINFMATIPDSVVQAPGVDYYVTATDGMTTCDDPSIDAINNPYKIAVTPNQAPVIEHTPITDGIFGKDIIVQATVTDNTNIVASVEFYYRKKGQLVFNKHTMNHTGNNIYETVISKRYSTEDDIEYYLKATDDFGISTFAAWPYEPYSIKMANAVGFNIIRSENVPEIYPNPIKNGRFTITFINTELAERCKITLLNATGMKLAEIRNEFLPVGKNVIPVQLKDIGRGIYLVEISTGKGVYYRKLVVE